MARGEIRGRLSSEHLCSTAPGLSQREELRAEGRQRNAADREWRAQR